MFISLICSYCFWLVRLDKHIFYFRCFLTFCNTDSDNFSLLTILMATFLPDMQCVPVLTRPATRLQYSLSLSEVMSDSDAKSISFRVFGVKLDGLVLRPSCSLSRPLHSELCLPRENEEMEKKRRKRNTIDSYDFPLPRRRSKRRVKGSTTFPLPSPLSFLPSRTPTESLLCVRTLHVFLTRGLKTKGETREKRERKVMTMH